MSQQRRRRNRADDEAWVATWRYREEAVEAMEGAPRSKAGSKRWTDEDEAYLKANYPRLGAGDYAAGFFSANSIPIFANRSARSSPNLRRKACESSGAMLMS